MNKLVTWISWRRLTKLSTVFSVKRITGVILQPPTTTEVKWVFHESSVLARLSDHHRDLVAEFDPPAHAGNKIEFVNSDPRSWVYDPWKYKGSERSLHLVIVASDFQLCFGCLCTIGCGNTIGDVGFLRTIWMPIDIRSIVNQARPRICLGCGLSSSYFMRGESMCLVDSEFSISLILDLVHELSLSHQFPTFRHDDQGCCAQQVGEGAKRWWLRSRLYPRYDPPVSEPDISSLWSRNTYRIWWTHFSQRIPLTLNEQADRSVDGWASDAAISFFLEKWGLCWI